MCFHVSEAMHGSMSFNELFMLLWENKEMSDDLLQTLIMNAMHINGNATAPSGDTQRELRQAQFTINHHGDHYTTDVYEVSRVKQPDLFVTLHSQ